MPWSKNTTAGDRRLVDLYMNYCKTIFERYKDKVKYWLTFNEINCGP